MKNLTLFIILSLLISVICTAQTKKVEAKPKKVEAVTEEPKKQAETKDAKLKKVETVQEEPKKQAMTEVLIETTMGNITIALYNETPLHRNNFVKLVNDKFYDGVLFHRIIQQFMIQTGDPDSKTAKKGQALGSGGPGYTIPAEILPQYPNKRGAVAAARLGDQQNPQRASSGSQFYIVDAQGGATWLDGQYTVFGEVIKGMEVVDLIAAQPKDQGNRPIEDIKIVSIKIVEKK